MKIPKKYKLFDSEIAVEFIDDLMQSTDCYGQWYESRSLIKLQTINDAYTDDSAQATFCHEFVHSILTNMGEFELNQNEKFIDIFSKLLKQALNTMEFETK